jgi:hypothetical protein
VLKEYSSRTGVPPFPPEFALTSEVAQASFIISLNLNFSVPTVETIIVFIS